jgi:hypothetical protein
VSRKIPEVGKEKNWVKWEHEFDDPKGRRVTVMTAVLKSDTWNHYSSQPFAVLPGAFSCNREQIPW